MSIGPANRDWRCKIKEWLANDLLDSDFGNTLEYWWQFFLQFVMAEEDVTAFLQEMFSKLRRWLTFPPGVTVSTWHPTQESILFRLQPSVKLNMPFLNFPGICKKAGTCHLIAHEKTPRNDSCSILLLMVITEFVFLTEDYYFSEHVRHLVAFVKLEQSCVDHDRTSYMQISLRVRYRF